MILCYIARQIIEVIIAVKLMLTGTKLVLKKKKKIIKLPIIEIIYQFVTKHIHIYI